MSPLIENLVTVISIVGTVIAVYVGAGEVASLRKETHDRSRFLAFMALGRRGTSKQKSDHTHAEAV